MIAERAVPPSPLPAFTTEEFRSRTAALQAGVQTAGIDALLLTTEPDVRYVSGFLTRFWESPTRPWFLVVPARGEPVAVVPAIGAALMARTWISDIRSWDSPDLGDDGVTLLAAALRECVPEQGRIGLPMGPETHLRMPLADYARLREQLEPRAVVDATSIIRRVREVKSPAEIERIRAACAIADCAFDAVPSFAGTGKPLEAIFRAFQVTCLEAGADWVPYLAGGAGPDGYADVISPATPEPLAAGDLLMLDTGLVKAGYFCDFDRNFAVGRASDAARRAHETLYAATEAGLALARPGITAAKLDAAMRNVIVRSGWSCAGGRLGHGLGTQLTEWPSLMPADRTRLRAGMVLTLEPWLELSPGRLMVHEENIVLTESGAELLSRRAPAELPVLD